MPGPRLVYIEQVPLYMTIGAWEKEQDCRWPPLDGDNDKTRKKQDDARSWAAFIANMRAKHFDGADYRDASMMGISSKMPIPDIFLACREAYNASAIHYKRIFVTSRPNAYFNFETDTLCLDWYNISNTQWDGNVPNHFDLWKGFRQEDVKDIRKHRISTINTKESRKLAKLRTTPSRTELSLKAAVLVKSWPSTERSKFKKYRALNELIRL
ncbi:uncharacterized protein LY89DRAFT_281370 [Mollisia scopiformis]|uniref:2EXR domain-containing protein n=1 Tax=Mollisia scopiformis TaxID=149040 RepID=A0A132BAF4_MOLSC|nr:uncharacterized protein LY89DRAFT_281370 [Mollisia scopiformis]KUJ09233.1 hypothetical protein LY89DRAFT_281370 [Mollisia scopiformis]